MLQLLCFMRPTKRGEGPQRRAEPGIQCILILCDICGAAFFAFSGVFLRYCDMTAVRTVVCRNSVSPPKLTGNTPVADIIQPVHINLAETFGNKFQLLILINLDGRLCQLVHLYKPLQFNHGFDGCVASFMAAYRMGNILDFNQIAFLVQLFYDFLSGLQSVHACKSACLFIHCAVIIHHANTGQVMSQPNLEVIRVMCRCNFYNTGTKFSVNIFIRNDGYFLIQNGNDTGLADQVLISFICGMYRNRSIAQHGFGSGGCQSQLFIRTNNGVIDMIKMPCHINVLYLCVGNCSLTLRTPVDNLFPAVNIALFIQTAEGFQNSFGAALVHRKAYTIPVTRAAQLSQLVQNNAAVFLLPSPCAFQKALTTNILLGQPFGCHLLHNLQFRGNACMVNAGYPECVVACHSFPANQDILHGVVQCMSHVQLPCNIRGRHYDAKRFFCFIYFCMEIFLFHPFVVKSFLYNRGVKILCQLFHSISSYFFHFTVNQKKPPSNQRTKARGTTLFPVSKNGHFIVCNGTSRLCLPRNFF